MVCSQNHRPIPSDQTYGSEFRTASRLILLHCKHRLFIFVLFAIRLTKIRLIIVIAIITINITTILQKPVRKKDLRTLSNVANSDLWEICKSNVPNRLKRRILFPYGFFSIILFLWRDLDISYNHIAFHSEINVMQMQIKRKNFTNNSITLCRTKFEEVDSPFLLI